MKCWLQDLLRSVCVLRPLWGAGEGFVVGTLLFRTTRILGLLYVLVECCKAITGGKGVLCSLLRHR